MSACYSISSNTFFFFREITRNGQINYPPTMVVWRVYKPQNYTLHRYEIDKDAL